MFKILIPARLNSQRLKRKLLEKVDYKTIIQMTWETCLKTNAKEVVVVTDSDEIIELIMPLKDKIPIFVISTIDIGVAEQNPVTSEAIVYVSVTAKAYQDDGLFYGTVASVEPQQFSASGPNQTVAETRAIVKAARAARQAKQSEK